MITLNLMDEQIFVCSKDEAKSLWTSDKPKRPYIWLESEVLAVLRMGAKEIGEIVRKKKSPDGFVYKG